tara:strand:- start:347 stop:1240 length:894 start_codon:yes stop_codon:yes gene_type:complete
MLNIKIIYILILCLFLHCSKDSNDSLPDDFQPLFKKSINFQGSDETLDIITWNIENFPINNTTIYYTIEIIDSLNADIIALQEISSEDSFNDMLILLEEKNWEGFRSGNENSDSMELAYLINTNMVTILEDPYEILSSNNFKREPFQIKVEFQNHIIEIINVHYKSEYNGNFSEMRREANQTLHHYLNLYPNKSIVVLGDFNDSLDDEQDNIFSMFINNPDYTFTDMHIAEGPVENWSYPTLSHIDHILITNELFNFTNEEKTSTVLLEHDSYTYDGVYEHNVSDHRPVGIKFLFEP